MKILFINIFFVGFMVSEIPRVSVFGHCPYSVTFPYLQIYRQLYWSNSTRSPCNNLNARVSLEHRVQHLELKSIKQSLEKCIQSYFRIRAYT